MLKRLITVVITVFCLLMTTACQPTPEAPIVMSKGDGKLQESVYGSSVPAYSEPYPAPNTWEETLCGAAGSKLTVELNAKVTVPDALEYPVRRVEKCMLTNDLVTKIINAYTDGAKLYKYDYTEKVFSKAYLNELIRYAAYELNNSDSYLNNGYAKDWGQAAADEKRQDVLRTQAHYQTLINAGYPKTEYTQPFEQVLDWESVYDETANIRIDFYRPSDLHNQHVSIHNSTQLDPKIAGVWHVSAHNRDLRGVNYDTCLAHAERMLDKLGFSDWSLTNIGSIDLNQIIYEYVMGDPAFEGVDWTKAPQGYYFTFTPVFDGIPLLYCTHATNAQYSQGSIAVPALHLSVTDVGVINVYYENMIKPTTLLNENVELMSFDKIQDIFRRYIIMETKFSFADMFDRNPDGSINENGTHGLKNTLIRIDDIRLGYVPIIEKDKETNILVPTWVFYGCQYDTYDPNDDNQWALNANGERVYDTAPGFAFMLINAIDGSIIDLSQGY